MRRLTTTIVMTLAWAATAAQTVVEPAEAEYPRYTVEVIIFEYAEEVSAGTEQFLPDEPPPPTVDEAVAQERVFGDTVARPAVGEQAPVEEEEAYPPGPEFVLHAEEELGLTDVAAMLERLDVYRPLMHFAWTQVTRPEEETQPIELQALAPPPSGLEGSFTLYLSRYLHLVVDLSLEYRADAGGSIVIYDPVTEFGDGRNGANYGEMGPAPVHYRITEDRIFKSGDLRYFDHPKFGVLAKITRLEEPEVDRQEFELIGEPGQ
jgi:hypothetical protein